MRLRNIKGSKEFIISNPYVIQHPEELRGKYNTLFKNNNPLHLEIGMGKGRFIHQLAAENPDINFIGIERYSSVLFRALEKREELELPNLYYLRFDAEYITDIFNPGEVNRIYLNFSDPWPKERHAKRRLTSPQFLARYDTILSPNGEVIFKTDNRDLFDFSVESIQETPPWHCRDVTYDLHHSQYLDGNIMTEYETRFVNMGLPIHRLIAFR